MSARWLLLLATHCSAALRNPFRAAPTHFDYIIVGGGTAGCVLADRLSAASKQAAGPAHCRRFRRRRRRNRAL